MSDLCILRIGEGDMWTGVDGRGRAWWSVGADRSDDAECECEEVTLCVMGGWMGATLRTLEGAGVVLCRFVHVGKEGEEKWGRGRRKDNQEK